MGGIDADGRNLNADALLKANMQLFRLPIMIATGSLTREAREELGFVALTFEKRDIFPERAFLEDAVLTVSRMEKPCSLSEALLEKVMKRIGKMEAQLPEIPAMNLLVERAKDRMRTLMEQHPEIRQSVQPLVNRKIIHRKSRETRVDLHEMKNDAMAVASDLKAKPEFAAVGRELEQVVVWLQDSMDTLGAEAVFFSGTLEKGAAGLGPLANLIEFQNMDSLAGVTIPPVQAWGVQDALTELLRNAALAVQSRGGRVMVNVSPERVVITNSLSPAEKQVLEGYAASGAVERSTKKGGGATGLQWVASTCEQAGISFHVVVNGDEAQMTLSGFNATVPEKPVAVTGTPETLKGKRVMVLDHMWDGTQDSGAARLNTSLLAQYEAATGIAPERMEVQQLKLQIQEALQTGIPIPYDMVIMHPGEEGDLPLRLDVLEYAGKVDPNFQLVLVGQGWMGFWDTLEAERADYESMLGVSDILANLHCIGGTPTPKVLEAKVFPAPEKGTVERSKQEAAPSLAGRRIVAAIMRGLAELKIRELQD